LPQILTRIPANLITGFLGSGKTTAIRALLDERPSGERWSVLINEFGTVSIDQTEFDAADAEVKVQELAGGCMCCTMSMIMEPLLARFLHQTQPDRLIIELLARRHFRPRRLARSARLSPPRPAVEGRLPLRRRLVEDPASRQRDLVPLGASTATTAAWRSSSPTKPAAGPNSKPNYSPASTRRRRIGKEITVAFSGERQGARLRFFGRFENGG
jgi:hypothetical protein